jgi:hypothetical protein
MEEHQVNRKQAFRLMEWALAKLAREEGQTVSIVARVDDDEAED